VVIDKRSPAVQAVEWLAAAGVKKCAFDAGQTSVAALELMKKSLPGRCGGVFLWRRMDWWRGFAR
jgi:Xaa-Pro aminopeptidase